MDGCYVRLHSIYDRKHRRFIYKHDRDAKKNFVFGLQGDKIEYIKDEDTKKLIYMRGFTHPDR